MIELYVDPYIVGTDASIEATTEGVTKVVASYLGRMICQYICCSSSYIQAIHRMFIVSYMKVDLHAWVHPNIARYSPFNLILSGHFMARCYRWQM